MSTNPEGLSQNVKESGRNLRSNVKFSKKNCVAAFRIRLTLRLHLDPVQGPAGCRLREVSPLPGAAAHLSFGPAGGGLGPVCSSGWPVIGGYGGTSVGNRNLLLGCSIFILSLAISPGQKTGPPPPSGTQPQLPVSRTAIPVDNPAADSHFPLDPADNADPQAIQRERLARLFAQEARKKNIADSEKLITLARELNAEYEKPVPAEASSNQFNKVKEIEKLAKRVQQRLTEQWAQ